MIPARAAPASRIVTAYMQNCLIIPGWASAATASAASCLSDEQGARFEGPRVCVNMVMSKIFHSGLFVGPGGAPLSTVGDRLDYT
jgi:hypothetical protein